MQDVTEEDMKASFLPIVQQAAMAFRQKDIDALKAALAEILTEIKATELWKGERAARAQHLDIMASRELGVDSMTTWLCPMLMREELAELAEELIEELSAAKKEEVLTVPLPFGTPPELLVSVGNHVLDWTMADGRFIWHGARAALKLIAEEAGELKLQVQDSTVLELGCGLGVVGMACARAGAKSVVLTDYDHELLRACQRSIDLNSLQHIVWTLHLDWNSTSAGAFPEELEGGEVDFLIGADIIYDADHAASVLGTIRHFLQAGRAKAAFLITGEPDRRQGVKQLDDSLNISNWDSDVCGQDECMTWTGCRLVEDRTHRLYRFRPS